MQRAEIPEEVLHFIVRRIDSVPHLETLLLLRENPAQPWTDEEVSARVYVSRELARSILQDLARHGMIAPAGASERYAYDAAWDEAQLMSKVAAAYRQHLTHVAGLIHSKASSEAVRQFARAFQFKNKE